MSKKDSDMRTMSYEDATGCDIDGTCVEWQDRSTHRAAAHQR